MLEAVYLLLLQNKLLACDVDRAIHMPQVLVPN